MRPALVPDSAPPRVALFEHALRLHRSSPDEPLVDWGHPLPDHSAYRARVTPVPAEERGAAFAAVLERHVATHGLPGPVHALAHAIVAIGHVGHDDPAVVAAVGRVGRDRTRRLGRALVRHSPDRLPVHAGLVLLAEGATEADVPLLQTIGLLSHTFGRDAVEALERRLVDPVPALLWLAERSDGWGRVHAVAALLRSQDPRARPWLMRRAVNGDYLNRYFAGDVAVAVDLHLAIAAPEADAELVDHTGRVLRTMAQSESTGLTLAHYEHAQRALVDYAAHAARLAPSVDRYLTLHALAEYPGIEVAPLLAELLERPGWLDGVRARLEDPGEPWHAGGERAADRLGVSVDRQPADRNAQRPVRGSRRGTPGP